MATVKLRYDAGVRMTIDTSRWRPKFGYYGCAFIARRYMDRLSEHYETKQGFHKKRGDKP